MANLNIAIQIAANDQASGPIGRITTALGGLKDRGLGGLQAAGKVALGGLTAGAGLVAGAVGLIGTAAFGVANDTQTATGLIQSQLGTTAEESERLAGLARTVWGDNFAGSITEAAGAIGLVRQQLGDLADDELTRSAENAFRLQDRFQVGIPESIDAANTLMDQFGLTSDQAFDFIATGFQRGLDRSGDFLDTIGEYSTQFAGGGASAGQFFGLLESGLQGGVLGTDKAADAFKEFRVRIQDGSTLTAESLELIGLSADDIAERMASGQLTAADAFTMVVEAMQEVDDQNVLMQAGVGLLGTQFEDLGTEGALGLSLIETSLADMEGATSSLDAQYNNLGSAVEGYKRRALLALEPISNVLLDVINTAMPLLDGLFATFETRIAPIFEDLGNFLGGFIAELQDGQTVWGAATEAILNWTKVGEANFTTILNMITGIETFTDRVLTAIQPITDWIANNVQLGDVLTAVGIVVAAVVIPALASIVAAAAPVILAGAALIAGIALVRQAWETDWLGIRTFVENAIVFIQNIITTVMTGIQAFWAAHGDTILTKAQEVWQFIQEWIDTSLGVISSVFAAFKSAFEGDWYGFGANLRDAWDQAWNFIRRIFSDARNALATKASEIIADIRARFTGFDWASLGRRIIEGIANAIRNGAGAIADAARAAAQAALDAAKGLLGIESPSKVAAQQIGAPFIQGIAQELADTSPLNSALAGIQGVLVGGALPSQRQVAAATGAPGGGSVQYIFNIDARGAAPGVERLIADAVNEALKRWTQRADARIRSRT